MPRPAPPVARLGFLLDGKFTVPRKGPNRVAADKMVAQLRAMKRIELIDVAQTTGFVMLAESVDADPTNAALWREYRAAEVALRAVGADDGSDELSKVIAAMSAAVGDTKNA